MRSMLGYDNRTVEALGMYQMLRDHLTSNLYRSSIKVVPDQFNNVNRLCSIEDGYGRVWQVKVTMRDQGFHRYVLVEHIVTGERRIVSMTVVYNLY